MRLSRVRCPKILLSPDYVKVTCEVFTLNDLCTLRHPLCGRTPFSYCRYPLTLALILLFPDSNRMPIAWLIRNKVLFVCQCFFSYFNEIYSSSSSSSISSISSISISSISISSISSSISICTR